MPYNKSKRSYYKSYDDLGRTQKWKRFKRQKNFFAALVYSIADAKNSPSYSSINPSDNFSETENLTTSQTNYFHAYASTDQCQSSSKLNNWVRNSDSDNKKSCVKLDPLNLKNFLKNWVLKEVNVPKSSVTSLLKTFFSE